MNHKVDYLRKNRKLIYGCLLIGGLLLVIYLVHSTNTPTEGLVLNLEEDLPSQNESVEPEVAITEGEPQLDGMVYIDVKGAVKEPNVYQIKKDKRIYDAIRLAGGFTADADQNQINLAARVKDEMVIYVPVLGEVVENIVGIVDTGDGESEKININTATNEQLQQLPGIGPSKAASIIAYREEKGTFTTIEDLLNIAGIGEKSFEKLKDHIIVNFIIPSVE